MQVVWNDLCHWPQRADFVSAVTELRHEGTMDAGGRRWITFTGGGGGSGDRCRGDNA